MIRLFRVLIIGIVIALFCTVSIPQEARSQEATPKAIVQLDVARVDVAYNLTGVNFATFTGSVIFDLNESEDGYVELEADAGGWPLVISPRAFYVPRNTTRMNIVVEVNVPPEVHGGITRILNIGGTIVTSEDNTTALPIEPAQGMISVSRAYSVSIVFRQPVIEVGPGSLVSLQAVINNHGSDGFFTVGFVIGEWFEQIGSSYSISTDNLFIRAHGSDNVNITLDLPDTFTLWTDQADSVILNITTQNGTLLDTNGAIVRVRGIYIGPFEASICGAFIVIIFLLLSFDTIRDKELRRDIRKLKIKRMVEKRQLKLEKKGVFIPETKAESDNGIIEKGQKEPLICPRCYSQDVKPLLSGKFKCRNCERLFEKPVAMPEEEGTAQDS